MRKDYLQTKLHEEVKRYIIDVLWHYLVYKRHADQLWKAKIGFHFAKLFATGIASSGLIALLFTDEQWLQIATTILSLIVFLINGLSRDYNYQELYKKSSRDAIRLWQLREESLDLLYEITYHLSSEEQSEARLSELLKQRQTIYEGLLPVPNKTLRRTQKHFYTSNAPIEEWQQAEEKVIPEELRQLK